jgi:hypothetical protein
MGNRNKGAREFPPVPHAALPSATHPHVNQPRERKGEHRGRLGAPFLHSVYFKTMEAVVTFKAKQGTVVVISLG